MRTRCIGFDVAAPKARSAGRGGDANDSGDRMTIYHYIEKYTTTSTHGRVAPCASSWTMPSPCAACLPCALASAACLLVTPSYHIIRPSARIMSCSRASCEHKHTVSGQAAAAVRAHERVPAVIVSLCYKTHAPQSSVSSGERVSLAPLTHSPRDVVVVECAEVVELL